MLLLSAVTSPINARDLVLLTATHAHAKRQLPPSLMMIWDLLSLSIILVPVHLVFTYPNYYQYIQSLTWPNILECTACCKCFAFFNNDILSPWECSWLGKTLQRLFSTRKRILQSSTSGLWSSRPFGADELARGFSSFQTFFFFFFFTALELKIIVCCSIKSSLLDLKYDTLWLQWKSTIILSLSRNLWTNYTLSLCCWALTATFSQFFSNFFSCMSPACLWL